MTTWGLWPVWGEIVSKSVRDGDTYETTFTAGKGWSEVQPDEYAEEGEEWWGSFFETDLKPAIAAGHLDGILRELARAVFDRRDVKMGQSPGHSFRNAKDGPKDGPLPPVVQGGSTQVDVQGVFVGKVFPVQADSGGSVQIEGAWYRKADFRGLIIRIPMTQDPSYIRGLRVRLIGVGDKRARIEWVDLPKDGSDYRRRADEGQPVFLPLRTLTDILG